VQFIGYSYWGTAKYAVYDHDTFPMESCSKKANMVVSLSKEIGRLFSYSLSYE